MANSGPPPKTHPSAPDDPKTSRPHDALFKAVFARPEHAVALFRELLPESVSAVIGWDTLHVVPGTFVDQKLDDRHTDLLYSVRLDGARAFLYVLLEHQSTVEHDMPFRMLEYLVRIWKRHRHEHPERALPIIIPMLVSHAPGGWTKPLTLAEMLEPHPSSIPELAPLIPNFSILLDDLVHLSNDQLKGRALGTLPTLALWLLRDARDARSLFRNLAAWTKVFRQLFRTPDGMDAVLLLLRYISCVCEPLQFDEFRAKIREQLPEAEYATMTIAEQLLNQGLERGLEQGREQGREQGLEQGLRLGRVDSLKKLLVLKFGDLRPEHLARVDTADLEQLDRYIERVLSALTIEELLLEKPPTADLALCHAPPG